MCDFRCGRRVCVRCRDRRARAILEVVNGLEAASANGREAWRAFFRAYRDRPMETSMIAVFNRVTAVFTWVTCVLILLVTVFS